MNRGQKLVRLALQSVSNNTELDIANMPIMIENSNYQNVNDDIDTHNGSVYFENFETVSHEHHPNASDNSPLDEITNNKENNLKIYGQMTPLILRNVKLIDYSPSSHIGDNDEVDLNNMPVVIDNNYDIDSIDPDNIEISEFITENIPPACTSFDVISFPDDTEIQIESSAPNTIKLVDYDTSSSDTSDNQKLHSIPLRMRRNSSDYSFNSDIAQSSSTSGEDNTVFENYENAVVGEQGLRKKRKLRKKTKKKMELNFGKKKSVKPNPCNKNCQHNCSEKFSESTRHDIFDFYWGLGNYQRQRDWLLSCMKEVDIKRRVQNASCSRRQRSFKYYVPWEEVETEVCQQFILKTLDISQMTLRYTKNASFSYKCSQEDRRGKKEPHNKSSSEEIGYVHEFIKKLPAVPSHYCRNKSSRKYLPNELRNVSFLYRVFKEDQMVFFKRTTSISLRVFRNIFKKDFNLGFHLPKKDKCSLCEARNDKNFQESEKSAREFEEHINNKNKIKELFLNDQKRHQQNSDFLCSSFDLQKVLNTPHGDNMLLYYSRKYFYYNETIYENGTQRAFCYLWGESDGNRGCSEMCTIIYKYLKEVDERKTVKNVALYCDSCAGQNRNRAMLAMLYQFIGECLNIESIKITYLLPGHSYMPVDSIHATIERFIKKRIIWAPSEWSTVIGNARINPQPLEIIKLHFSDFMDWKSVGDNFFKSKVENIKTSQLRLAYFEKGKQEIGISYTYDEKTLKTIVVEKFVRKTKEKLTRANPRNKDFKPEKLYFNPLPLTPAKKKDLLKLCKSFVIPSRYRDEYMNLKASDEIEDILAETDDEDPQTEEGEI